METYLNSDEWEVISPGQSPQKQQRMAQDSDFLNSDEWEVIDQPKKLEVSNKSKRSKASQAGRIGAQFAVGAAESALLPYELASASLSSQPAQELAYREQLFDDLEMMQEQKQTGVWSEQDQKHYDNILDQIKNPEKAKPFVKTADIGIRGLAEKATGVDLRPEGMLEKAASWAGFIKDPKKISELRKIGYNPKDVLKAISPSKTETLRGLGAGAALEMAEEGNFGPIGTLAAAVVGDLAGGGVSALGKVITSPKKTLAKGMAKLTSAEKLDIQKQIINDFREAGIQADIGTVTDNQIVKWTQAKLAQSGLTGKPFNELREKITSDIKNEYKKLAEDLGEYRFQTLHEAGEVTKEYLTEIRNAEKSRISDMYSKARERLELAGEQAAVNPINLAVKINEIEAALSPGKLKSTEQKAVLDTLEKLKQDVYDPNGKLKLANVENLLNDKIALNDIINYEVQGGQKQLLKTLVKELDKEILSYGKKDKEFFKNYYKANKDFEKHAKTFRNDNVNRILISQDPMMAMNKMNTIQGMRDIGKALGITPEGKKLFNDLKRLKLDQMVGNKMADNVSQQLKMGTFANLLKNPKDMQLVKELVGEKAFKGLQRLQKISGDLEKTARQFFNASQSGVHVVDVAVVGSALSSIGAALSGNPWPIIKSAAGIASGTYLSNLMGDPAFIKLVEEAVLASNKNDISKLMMIGKRLEGPIKAAIVESKHPPMP